MAGKKLWYEHIIFKIGGIIILLITPDQYIDYKIDNKYKDPELTKQIASHIRPTLIFDHLGTIRYDGGADQFISSIEVKMEGGEPNEIIISPRDHLDCVPVLESINDIFDAVSKQINKSDWLFELSNPDLLRLASSQEKKEWLFRLEIIQ